MPSTLAAPRPLVKDTASFARVRSVDILRGAVMVLMAIDHVRVYSGLPAGGPNPGIFFTRWVTHFCAPAFVFFAGTSAFLYGRKLSKPALSKYLLTRGLMLVVLELTLIKFSWTFNFDYNFILAGVIWMIGWCMVLMAALVWLRPAVVGVLGLLIISLQDVFGKIALGTLWEFIYPSGSPGVPGVTILYVLVPWIGVMAAGYGFGLIVNNKRACLIIGLSAIAAFLIAGTILAKDDSQPFIFQLLNQRKYPASQLFLLMTLGPVIALTPFADKARGWLANVLTVFGKVPFFYYLLHIPLIHLTAIVVNEIIGLSGYTQFYATAPYVGVPPELRWHLWLLYAVWVIDVAVLYVLCRWYVKYKFAHPDKKWLRYL